MKIIDFHTHIFPPALIRKRHELVHEESAFSLLYSSDQSKLITADELIKSMDENEIDVSVAVGFPWKSKEIFRAHNDYLLETRNKYPDRLKVLVCFDLSVKGVAVEFEKCVKDGTSGAGELAFYNEAPDDLALENLDAIMTVSARNKLPVLIHANEPVGHAYPGKNSFTPAPAYDLAKKYPENKIVFAHWGGGLFFYNLMKREVKDVLRNVYVDTAASPFLYDPDIYRIASEIFGSERILFGSDYPLIRPSRYFEEMKKSGISEKDLIRIKGENASCLLGISENQVLGL
ncbi:amidohydrolase family protein [Desulforegula conservatrix]|uniref:amidohydrolase family protein n=1 Tax=Desulforegula conservatrix TaxID=153026 RepID=UPI000409AA0F|nr:amidohydrolase family protein [Desulforegula conservatrix]